MNTVAAEAINIGLLCAEFVLFLFFIQSFLNRKRSTRFFLISGAIFIFVDYLITQLLPIASVRMIVLIVLFGLFIYFIYDASLVSSFVSALSFLSILTLSEIILMYGVYLISDLSPAALQEMPYTFCQLAFLAKLFQLFIVSVFCSWNNRNRSPKPFRTFSFLRFSIFPFSSFISSLLIYYASVQCPEISLFLLFCVILLLITNISSILLIRQFEEQQNRLTESYILHKQLDSAVDGISAAMKSYENERRLTHDFQNHLIVLRGMLEKSDQSASVIDYLNQIAQYTNSTSLSVSTNRTAADVIFNQKYITCQQKNIHCQFRLDDLSVFPLPDNALVVLLSNLLDNAIEACEKIPIPSNRKIMVKMHVSSDECMIFIQNTTAAPVHIKDNQIKTTKPETHRHGFGMKNITSIIEAYHGTYTIAYEALYFIFVAVFPGPQNELI